MIRALLFDLGGTLDGDGHWLERFLTLYRSFGVELPRETIRDAFDEAERRAAVDEEIADAHFDEMVALHVRWQLERLGLTNDDLARHLITGFSTPARAAAGENARLLAALAERGFALGVVSNGCGNVERLCADFGYTSYLALIVDSRRLGISKPAPAIYQYAADKMNHAPEVTMMIGDSFERDVVPAKKIGMKTAWLEPDASKVCPDASHLDLRLHSLSELPAALP